MTRRRPFCGDRTSALCYDRWTKYLEVHGVDLNEADRLLVGLLASREANLQAFRVAIGKAGIDRRLELGLAEDRAARSFGVALDRAERVFSPRILDEGEVALAPAVGDGRLLPFKARGLESRILAALSGGVRLTKSELRARVKGGNSPFLKAIRALTKDGRLITEGRGRRNYPKRYVLASEAEEA